MTTGPDDRPPSVADLQRLLAFLSIRPCVEVQALVQLLERVPTIDLTSQQIGRFDDRRETVVDNRDQRQLGLFDFYLGLIFLGYKRYADAVPCFELALNQWSFFKERPHICLARFAMGAAYHHDMDLAQAAGTYAEVEQEANRIRHELQDGYLSRMIPYQRDFADYQGFIEQLTKLLEKAQISLNLDELTGVRPIIPPPQVRMNIDESSPDLIEPYRFDQKRLLLLLDDTFSEEEIKEICFFLEVQYENLAGSGKRNKARELISFLRQRARVHELLNELRRRRPAILWHESISHVSQPSPTPPPKFSTPIVIGRREWFQVVRKTEPFLNEIEEGDWLYAPSEQVGEREAEGHVIIDTPVGGSIEVKSEDQRSGPALFLARFVRNTATGEVHVVTRSDFRSVTLDPRQIRGNVIRHCKNC